MFNLDYFLSLYLFFISCFIFRFYFKHLILIVIRLEFIVIFTTYNIYIIIINLESESFLILFFLVFSVCEGALVLSILVVIVRLYGNDYINSLRILKW